jgi:uncharacterized membrane protein YccC
VSEREPEGVQQVLRKSLSPVAETAHESLRLRVGRVRSAWRPILQSGIAAGLAWFLARLIVGAPDPFFAPAAAVLSIGLARGQHLRRSAEVAAGVAIGIGVAFLLRSAIGLGPVQIGGIVALTIAAALLVDASVILVNQAAISAVLVMTLPTAGLSNGPDRFFDALVGGAVAIVVSQVVFVRDPTGRISAAVGRTVAELSLALREASEALETGALITRSRACARSIRASRSCSRRWRWLTRPSFSRPLAAAYAAGSSHTAMLRGTSTTRCATRVCCCEPSSRCSARTSWLRPSSRWR